MPELLQEEKKTEQKSGKHAKSKAQTDPKLNQFELITKLSSAMSSKLEYELWKFKEKAAKL